MTSEGRHAGKSKVKVDPGGALNPEVAKWPDGNGLLKILDIRGRAGPPGEDPMTSPGGEGGG